MDEKRQKVLAAEAGQLQLTEAQATEWYSRLIAPVLGDYPSDAYLAVSIASKGYKAEWAEASDLNAVIRIGRKHPTNCFPQVSLSSVKTATRGTNTTALPMYSLVADLDTSRVLEGVQHKGNATKRGPLLPLPSDDYVLETAARLGEIAQVMLVKTGGGYHLWTLIERPLAANDSAKTLEAAATLEGWKRYWMDKMSGDGFHVDDGVLADKVRLLRLPGSWRWKGGQALNEETGKKTGKQIMDPYAYPVDIEIRPDSNLPRRNAADLVAELLATLPPTATKPAKSSQNPPGAAQLARRTTGAAMEPAGGIRPGDRLLEAVAVSEMLAAIGFEMLSGPDGKGQTHWVGPGSTSGEPNTVVYPDDEDHPYELVSFFGQSPQKMLRLTDPFDTDPIQKNSYDAFGLLIRLCRSAKHAAKVAATYPNHDDFLAFVEANWKSLVEDHKPELSPSLDLDPKVAPADMTTAELIATNSALAVPIHPALVRQNPTANTYFAVLSGPDTGVYYRTLHRMGDEKPPYFNYHQVTDWVAIRTHAVIPVKRPEPGITEPDYRGVRYQVSLRTPSGVHTAPELLLPEESETSLLVLRLFVGVPAIRPGRKEVTACSNMLANLDIAAVQKSYTYRSQGWVTAEGKFVWVGATAAATSSGPSLEYPLRGENGRPVTRPGVKDYGLPHTLRPIATAGRALREFIAICPQLTVPLIGTLISAFVGIRQPKVAMGLVGPSQTGKSRLDELMYAFSHKHNTESTGVGDLVAQTMSAKGALALLELMHDSCISLCDFRLDDEDKQKNLQYKDAFRAVVHAAHAGGVVEAKSKQTGGLRDANQSAATVIFDGEASLVSDGDASRVVQLKVADITVLDPHPGTVMDKWKDAHARSDNARSLLGHFLVWLAGWVEDHTPDDGVHYDTLAAESHEIAIRHRSDLIVGRASEIMSVTATGWTWLYKFAKDMDIEATLPPKEEVRRILRKVGAEQDAANKAGSSGPRLVRSIAEMLQAGTGHLVTANSGIPDDPARWGWKPSPGKEEAIYLPTQQQLGRLSEDYRSVLITETGLKYAAAAAGMGGLVGTQLTDAIKPFCTPDSTPGGKVARSFAPSFGVRPVGYWIPIDTIMGTDDDDDGAQPELSIVKQQDEAA